MLGLLVLCAAEAALRAFDYGGPRDIFITVPDGEGGRDYVTNTEAFRATFASNPVIRAQDWFP
ncbi:MAG: hypothetical protein AMK73_08645, partial [Planctomycetes bacterium SM23_32]